MKIAILHDDFSVWGGAEQSMVIAARELNADIITYSIGNSIKPLIQELAKNVKIIQLAKQKHKIDKIVRYSFEQAKFDYDFYIFSGNLSIYAAKNHKPNLWYCHCPLRGLYDKSVRKSQGSSQFRKMVVLKNRLTKKRLFPRIVSAILSEFLGQLHEIKTKPIPFPEIIYRLFILPFKAGAYNKYQITKKSDQSAVQSIQKIIANSSHIESEIQRIYKKTSTVIYPPIEISKFSNKSANNYWVSINRIVPHKRIGLQLKAFQNLPKEKLYIIGNVDDAHYYKKLQKMKPSNVYFLGLISEKKLSELISKTKGLLFTAQNEDFGIAPVQAIAAGKPVIAPNEGGLRETVDHMKTGLLINDISPKKIVDAITKINRQEKTIVQNSKKRVKKFSVQVFVKKITKEISA